MWTKQIVLTASVHVQCVAAETYTITYTASYVVDANCCGDGTVVCVTSTPDRVLCANTNHSGMAP